LNKHSDSRQVAASLLLGGILVVLAVVMMVLQAGCAHSQQSWRTKGLAPAESTADAIEASFGPRRVALLIGVGSYDDPLFPDLMHAENDAVEFGEILETRDYGGFDRIIVLTTPVQTTQARILTELVSLKNDLRSQDTLMVYFSGHGTMRLNDRDEPTLYLVTSDAKARDLGGSTLELAELQGFFTRIRAERKALVIDACFHGDGKSAVQPTVQQRLERMDAYPTLSRRVKLGQSEAHLFATSWGRPAREDDELQHGVYTYHLLQGLTWSQQDADANADGLVTIYEAHDYARGSTVAFTDGAQVPEAYFRVVGEKDLIVTGEPDKLLESQMALIYFYDSTDSAFAGATLKVDGRQKGVFPGSIPVDPGRHRITIVSPDGVVLFDRAVDIDYQESIPADNINSREPVHKGFLSTSGGLMVSPTDTLRPLMGTTTAAAELNLGLRFLADPRFTGFAVSFQLGYMPLQAAFETPHGTIDLQRQSMYLGMGYGYRFTHRNFSFGVNWRVRGSIISAPTVGTCNTGDSECDGWLLFSQGPYLEQVFRIHRKASIVLGEELMGSVVDPTTQGTLTLSPTLMFRVGMEFNL